MVIIEHLSSSNAITLSVIVVYCSIMIRLYQMISAEKSIVTSRSKRDQKLRFRQSQLIILQKRLIQRDLDILIYILVGQVIEKDINIPI